MNLFTLDLVLIIPGLFMILNLLVILVYAVFNQAKIFSRYLVEDIIITVSFVLMLTITLFLNQVTES